jgi:Holliday junction DNA helicase RuvA
MIGVLQGEVYAVGEGHITLMCHGVGYDIAVADPGAYVTGVTITLHTYLAVRETALDLYGFAGERDKQLFALLLSVPKIGPKSALQVMTQASTPLLVECIQTENPGKLYKMSGVGKKTSENIVNALQGKVEAFGVMADATEQSRLTTEQMDVFDALIALGFTPEEARERASTHTSVDNISDSIKAALS